MGCWVQVECHLAFSCKCPLEGILREAIIDVFKIFLNKAEISGYCNVFLAQKWHTLGQNLAARDGT